MAFSNCAGENDSSGALTSAAYLGWNYLNGRGARRAVVPNAAEQGHAGAQFQLTAMYCTSTGVVRDLEEAINRQRYRRWADGEVTTHTGLARILMEGRCIAPSLLTKVYSKLATKYACSMRWNTTCLHRNIY